MRWCFGLIVLTIVGGVADHARAAGGTVLDGPLPADPFCAARSRVCTPPPYVMVLSAFPAELKPLVVAARVTEIITTGERTYRVGVLGGTRVVLVRGGIGLVNAATTTRGVLDRFRLSAIVFSGVAGSGLDIGDVAVPAEWSDGTASFPVGARLLRVARTLAAPPVPMERCTPAPPNSDPPGPVVCLDHSPRIVAGGRGVSADPFGGRPVACLPGRGPGHGLIFGCDEGLARFSAAAASLPDATDMETAAVARVARDAGVPFIAFRGVSDGNGDPLDLGGFPGQFFYYYALAADNAAAVTTAFLQAWSARHPGIAGRRRGPRMASSRLRVGAACDWPHAAGRACPRQPAPRDVTIRVDRACGLLSKAAAADPGSAAAREAARGALRDWRRAARLMTMRPHPELAAGCRHALTRALKTRATGPSP